MPDIPPPYDRAVDSLRSDEKNTTPLIEAMRNAYRAALPIETDGVSMVRVGGLLWDRNDGAHVLDRWQLSRAMHGDSLTVDIQGFGIGKVRKASWGELMTYAANNWLEVKV